MSTAAPFTATGPLPMPGITLLEASAGTGKTYAITSLALRYVGDGIPLDRILAVTFTRAATGELRERIRTRFVAAERAMATAEAGGGVPKDPVAALLCEGGPGAVRERRARIGRALADFDAATITTTHGFCQRVLESLGTAGDVGRDMEITPDISAPRREVIDDVAVRHGAPGPDHPIPMKTVRAIGSAVIADRTARLLPDGPDPGTLAASRLALAVDVRDEFERRTRAADLVSYDDLLLRLDATLTREPGADACRARLAERYDVVLVDEFQDTDPLQWRIIRNAFPTQTLVLIGDPKQAIYSFRGADVFTYLAAAAGAGRHATLDTTWRSDEGVVRALDRLLGRATLGDPRIAVAPVEVAEPNRGRGISGAGDCAAMRIRLVDQGAGLVETGARGGMLKDSLVAHIADDLAAQVVTLLGGTACPDRTHGPDATRPLCAGGVCALTRTHAQAVRVRDALVAVGVPAVIMGTGSVFLSPAATDWRRLLDALERPADPARASVAALTVFLGWTAARLDGCDEDEREGLHETLHGWRAVLEARGVAALVETVMRGQDVAARALACEDGERRLTDIRHIGQLLHLAAVEDELGVSALRYWLARRIEEAGQDVDEERTRRLDSDADAVQVMTIHACKGLEFDVVCLPYLWSADTVGAEVPHIPDPAGGGGRILDVGGSSHEGYSAHRDAHEDAGRGEELRLAYVALTRARHQILLWCTAHGDMRRSALGRLLMDREPGRPIGAALAKAPSQAAVRDRLNTLAADSGGTISVTMTEAPPGTRHAPAAVAAATPLELAVFGRGIDHGWGRHSFSALTAGAWQEHVASEPEHDPRDDEPAPPASEGQGEGYGLAAAPPSDLPMGDLPAGTAFGSLVHAALEAADFAAADLPAEIARALETAAAREGGDPGLLSRLAPALEAVLHTPLGSALGHRRLRDVPRRDRLDELAFELPLTGGERPGGSLRLEAVADLFAHHVPAGDPLSGYAGRLRSLAAGDLRGFMVGAIDLVVRIPGHEGQDRFAIVDYKTNRLGGVTGPTVADYRPDRLADAMGAGDYVLQALVYQVALHRYLRGRLAGYAPDLHLAGAHYLFLRGMVGTDTPRHDGQPYGVFSWRPPAALVSDLSDLFDRGAA